MRTQDFSPCVTPYIYTPYVPLIWLDFSLLRITAFFHPTERHAESSRAAASFARSSINVACTCILKSRRTRKNLQAAAYKHFHVGILVMPRFFLLFFYVYRITRFDQSSRLTACFRLECNCVDLCDIRLGGKIMRKNSRGV